VVFDRAVLDTSIFIAAESGRQLRYNLLPAEGVSTVITLAELNAGVLAAKHSSIRSQRLRTLTRLAAMELLSVDISLPKCGHRCGATSQNGGAASPSTTCGLRLLPFLRAFRSSPKMTTSRRQRASQAYPSSWFSHLSPQLNELLDDQFTRRPMNYYASRVT
jgi:hypothetical protein